MPRKRKTTEQEIQIKNFTQDEIKKGIAKLNIRISDLELLDPTQDNFDSQKVENLQFSIRESIREVFGNNSPEFKQYQRFIIWDGGFNMMDSDFERQAKFSSGIPEAIEMVKGLISRLAEKGEYLNAGATTEEEQIKNGTGNDKVFIVHGRNDRLKEEVARLITTLDLSPIILHEQASKGKTLIEKIEHHSDVGFAIVLLTGDDLGCLKDDSNDSESKVLKPRARQNVVFELGYFMAALGRPHVCALYEPGVERPTDVDGVVYVQITGAWKMELCRELKSVFDDLDINKLIK